MIHLWTKAKKKANITVFSIQFIIGIICAIVDLLILFIAKFFFEDVISFCLGFIFGTFLNYYLTIKYSFQSKHKIKSTKKEIFFFFLTYIIAGILQIIIIKLLYLFDISIYVSKPIGIIMVFIFTLFTKWIFIFGINSEKRNF